jgi:1-phosphofructokinase family hexose kinase
LIITLTPNTAIDYTLKTPRFVLGETIRTTESAWGMGGKPADAAWILGKLGYPCLALGFVGGENGRRMERMFQDHGVKTDFLQVEGETRLNVVMVQPGKGQSTFTSTSLTVTPQQADEQLERFESYLPGAECAVLGGSLPAGAPRDFYEQAIRLANTARVPVIFDASGPALASGLSAQPSLIKPNRSEMEELMSCVVHSLEEAVQAAVVVHEQHGTGVIVTLGDEGAIAVLDDGRYFIPPVTVSTESTAGAGDGVLAGMAMAYYRKEPLHKGLYYGFALAGAVVQTLATADFEISDYERMLACVIIEKI